MGHRMLKAFMLHIEDTLNTFFLENNKQGKLLTSVESDCSQKSIIYSLRERTAGFMGKETNNIDHTT